MKMMFGGTARAAPGARQEIASGKECEDRSKHEGIKMTDEGVPAEHCDEPLNGWSGTIRCDKENKEHDHDCPEPH